ncbi:helix-turn-helix domain-containing protein [Spirillospora sp. NPDC048911]
MVAELRSLREDCHLIGDEVAAELFWSTAKVSRIENARTGP